MSAAYTRSARSYATPRHRTVAVSTKIMCVTRDSTKAARLPLGLTPHEGAAATPPPGGPELVAARVCGRTGFRQGHPVSATREARGK